MEIIYKEEIDELTKKKIGNIVKQRQPYIALSGIKKNIVIFDRDGYVILKKKNKKQLYIEEYKLNCKIIAV